ncbi:MAG: hypothetical protein EOQ52_20355 [Mesorhizobium sp.]|uniref:hypothetical protein n=1 Tax=Mesorhizobium sp. TaxID=1871066 RepID=UPI000FE6BA48|nr:hypothetical protein [Mesorhizobium sp.]RWB85906.1 MAG: hypothetical protein EOQ52_20355 [Mesorhizobium sp.]
MAAAYGSVASPVNLGPFSRIVEVHWRRMDYIAIQTTLQSSNPQGSSAACSPGTNFPDPNPGYYSGCIDKTEYQLGLVSPGFTASANGFRNNRDWISISNVAFAGVPETPGAGTIFDHAVDEWQFPNQAEFVAGGGSALDIPLPGHPDLFFDDETSLQAVSLARPQNEGAICISVPVGGTGVLWFPSEPSDPGTMQHSAMDLDLSDMTATFRGDTFRLHGIKTIQNTVPPLSYVDTFPIGLVWLLYKREIPTP